MVFGKKKHITMFDEVLESSWKLLHEGFQSFRSPLHHAALTTIDGDKPRAQLFILREFSEKNRIFICHCDIRSCKVLQIRDNRNVSRLFYDSEKWLQVRLS
ncbi:MAG: hypothetical protein KBB67_05900 [Syntrophorhabdus sp.]|jgi:pyridoxine/pyridoxamine 5'-phosphate oxidase|nr:hypothetical protein [Syntrophorhabdus sp.]OQB76232.1 MAG: Pyridoxamine 5'-phosphate oxidase [Deltaproteobacteria bacterium ADurb.Bin135]